MSDSCLASYWPDADRFPLRPDGFDRGFPDCNRTPFDLPECETELIGGYHTEYSSMKLGFYLFAEYINMFVSGAVMATLYFGGYDYPFYETVLNSFGENVANLIGFGALVGKALFFVFVFMWVRWTLPRFRYDQLMSLGWTGLIPIAMFNVVWTGLIILLPAEFNLSSLASFGIAIAGIPVLLAGLYIYHSIAGDKKKKTALAR